MLDSEPDTNDQHTPDSAAESAETTPPPRRRRAATRPAGPPSAPPEPAPVEDPETAAPPAAEASEVTPSGEGVPPARRTRAPRKRAAAPPTEPVEAAPLSGDAVEPAPTGPEQLEPAPVADDEVRPGPDVTDQPVQPAPDVSEPEAAASDVPELEATEPEADELEATEPEADELEATEPKAVEPEVPELEAPEAQDSDAALPVEDEAADDTEDESEGEGDTDSQDGTPRRRRRRRGGRRRRRGGGGEDGEDGDDAEGEPVEAADAAGAETGAGPSESDAATDAEAGSEPGTDEDPDIADGEGTGTRRRRRRRRRRGEDTGGSADDSTEVVVRVREPRSRKQAASEVTGISGSTRMEAKRQRRREGREAGRRRAPILSEAEFLARRESVARTMVIRQREDPSTASEGSLSQIAVLEDGILVEHYVDRDSAASLIGNVYLGRVQNVLPSMEAAFIDIGRGRNAVLYAGEVDWSSFSAEGQQRKVENVLKSGQTVLVQVTKDPVGAKGARLTNHVSIPGRYIVYAPGGHLSGISRKLPHTERRRLKDILSELVPDTASVIVRTAAEGASEDELVRDVNRLKAQWEDIERKVKAGSAPQLLYGEPDLTLRIVRDLFTEDFTDLIVQGDGSTGDAYDAVDAYVAHVAPHLHDRLRRWDPEVEGDLFAAYRLDEQIAKALERKVFLPSGGSLVIDRTEAMTVIDVNTGKFTGSGGNLEATVTSNNLEAAEEIVRQLRLRDIGGIIVIDFIDMVLPANRELLLRRLVECLGRDRTRHQVAEVTSLGLVQMTRKKIGTGLLEAFSTECPTCHGRGYETHDLPIESQKQPDGGTRESRPRERSRGGRSGRRGGKGEDEAPAADAPEVAHAG